MEFPEIRRIYIAISTGSLIYHRILGTISSYIDEYRAGMDSAIKIYSVTQTDSPVIMSGTTK